MLEKHEELASFSVLEGEEHVAELVGNEAVFQGVFWRGNWISFVIQNWISFVIRNWISFVGKPLVTDARVPGRVLGHHVFYEKVGAEPYIVQTVKEGYRCRIGFFAALEFHFLR